MLRITLFDVGDEFLTQRRIINYCISFHPGDKFSDIMHMSYYLGQIHLSGPGTGGLLRIAIEFKLIAYATRWALDPINLTGVFS